MTIYCGSKGGSDYCGYCGKDMSRAKQCAEEDRLRSIPADQVRAFGCAVEAEDVADGMKSTPCEKWCCSPDCPVTLKPLQAPEA